MPSINDEIINYNDKSIWWVNILVDKCVTFNIQSENKFISQIKVTNV